MNFDDIKNEWDNEPTKHIKLPDSVQQLYGEQSPVLKIRKNMRLELVGQVFVIILFGFIPQYYKMEPVLKLPFYLLYTLLVALSIYFFGRFYFFYNKMGHLDFSTKENLYELYYELKLNIEVYKTFTYMLIPSAVVLGMILRYNIYMDFNGMAFSATSFLGFHFWTYLIFFAIFLVVVYLLTEWWVKWSYGRYAKQIEGVIEEMREE